MHHPCQAFLPDDRRGSVPFAHGARPAVTGHRNYLHRHVNNSFKTALLDDAARFWN
jgi:hypothetical protein